MDQRRDLRGILQEIGHRRPESGRQHDFTPLTTTIPTTHEGPAMGTSEMPAAWETSCSIKVIVESHIAAWNGFDSSVVGTRRGRTCRKALR